MSLPGPIWIHRASELFWAAILRLADLSLKGNCCGDQTLLEVLEWKYNPFESRLTSCILVRLTFAFLVLLKFFFSSCSLARLLHGNPNLVCKGWTARLKAKELYILLPSLL